MSYLRYSIEFAFKEPVKPQVINRLKALENELRLLKKEAVIINEGQVNEENTKEATHHTCHHDEGLPCEPEQDI